MTDVTISRWKIYTIIAWALLSGSAAAIVMNKINQKDGCPCQTDGGVCNCEGGCCCLNHTNHPNSQRPNGSTKSNPGALTDGQLQDQIKYDQAMKERAIRQELEELRAQIKLEQDLRDAAKSAPRPDFDPTRGGVPVPGQAGFTPPQE